MKPIQRIVMGGAALLLSSMVLGAEGSSLPIDLDLKAQPIADALNQWAQKTGFQLIFPEEGATAGIVAPEVKGTYLPRDALLRLLKNSGLEYEFINERTVAIRAVDVSAAGDAADATSSASVRMAQAANEASVKEEMHGEKQNVVEEIIVTAQKRDERLQDVPVPVTAIKADLLVNSNQLHIQDYFTSVPGLNVEPSIQSNQTLSIRGITTGAGNPTVGITVDDMPYGASTNFGGGRAVPDIDPSELERIEVLRGPQGTLYGASSLGGLMKFVTRDPSTAGFNSRVQAGTSSVENGDELGYNVRGSVNVPLGDTLAIRGSAFKRRDAGYVDNVQTGESGANRANAVGGRLSALWKPSDAFSLKLGALLQEIEGHGASSVDPAIAADLQQSRLRETGWYKRTVQAYSAALTAKLGSVDLTSISGYNINSFADSTDFTFLQTGVAQSNFGVSGVALLSDNKTEKFTQEIRLLAPFGRRFEWLFGAFYTNEDSALTDTRPAVNPTTGAWAGFLSFSSFPTTFEEYAAFIDLTYHVTDRFDIQIGGRHSKIRQTFRQDGINLGIVQPTVRQNAESDAFTYLVTPRFKLSPDLMMYARLASGYRAGGTNISTTAAAPPYDPDKTRNYEIGVKGNLYRMLSFDASLYYIDWQDIQLSVLQNGFVFTINGSRAKSQGVELSMETRPLPGMTIAGWAAWGTAELTEALPATATVYGVSGSRLPNSSRSSGNLSVDQQFPLIGEVTGSVGGSISYVGDRTGRLRGLSVGVPLPRQDYPAYTQVDLHAGVSKDNWEASLFVTNVGDKRGALYGGLGGLPPTAFIYIQPRTFGISLSRDF